MFLNMNQLKIQNEENMYTIIQLLQTLGILH